MPRYRVSGRIEYTLVEVTDEVRATVEAGSEKEAEALALSELRPGEAMEADWYDDGTLEVEEVQDS